MTPLSSGSSQSRLRTDGAELRERPKKGFKTNCDESKGGTSRRYHRERETVEQPVQMSWGRRPAGELKVHSIPGAEDTREARLER